MLVCDLTMNRILKLMMFACLPGVASCGSIIYAVDGGFSSQAGGQLKELYTIDISLGTTTTTTLNTAIASLAEFQGVLYGIGTDSVLYSITASGVETEIADLSSLAIGDAAGFTASSNGTLYAASFSTLYQLSLDGDVLSTLALDVSASGSVDGDLAFINNTLYATVGASANSLATINTSTGAVTVIGTVSQYISGGLAYVPGPQHSGALVAVGPGPSGGILLDVTPSTGRGIFIESAPAYISDAAYDMTAAAPEPASAGLIAIGMLGLGIVTRRAALRGANSRLSHKG